ncbi:MAG: hypothetical protein WB985_10185, partial [Candidatus Acidiferrales bacterium]
MANLFQALQWMHVTAGGLALILFWIPAIAPKGGKTHVRAGWFYVACMSVVVVTALALSGLAFTIPLIVRRIAQPLSPAELADFLRGQRISATFLAYLAGLTLAAGWQGIWAVEAKREPKTMRTPFTLALNVLVFLAGLIVLVLGITYRSGPLVALSPIGPFLAAGNLRYVLRGPQSRMHWWYVHLSSMIATAIAGYTAFLVFGAARLLPSVARSQLYTIFWILPALIGIPVIRRTVAFYQRKFHETGAPSGIS